MISKAASSWRFDSILTSPQFIFRVETEPAELAAGAVYSLSDLDLASRLSFFLWSSIPDETLLVAAERGAVEQIRPSSIARCGGCWPTLAPTRSCRTSRDSGSICAT